MAENLTIENSKVLITFSRSLFRSVAPFIFYELVNYIFLYPKSLLVPEGSLPHPKPPPFKHLLHMYGIISLS